MMTWIKPIDGEFLEYQRNYIKKVPDGDLIAIMKKDIAETSAFLRSIPNEKLSYRYADGKWTIPQIIQHLIDTERIMSYRALCFARNDKTELPGFEENDYAREANTDDRKLEDLIAEYQAVRNSTVPMFESFNDEILKRSGIANRGRVTVNTLAHVIAGHELHHVSIVKERYLSENESGK